MSTKNEWDVPKPLEGEAIPPSKQDQVAANLESDLQQERDSHKEERFFWIFTVVILGNVLVFNSFSSAWALLPTLLLELVFLIGLADWLGVDRVKVLLEKLYAKYLNHD